MLTEQEAATKWCPMARVESSPMFQAVKDPTTGETIVPLSGTVSVNRGGAGARDEVCCAASNCMMWRRETEEYTRAGGDPLATVKPRRPTGRGYCGLAGNPVAL